MLLGQRLARHLCQPRGGLLGRWLTRRMARANAPLNEWTLTLLDLQPGDRVLEIGFGPGLAIQQAAQVAGFVAGLDASAAMLRQARARNARAIREGRVELRLGDGARSMPYGDGSFDKLYAVQVFHFLSDPLPFLREARRVLKPGGQAAMTVRAPEALKETLAQAGVYTLYTGDEIARLFHEAGLSTVRVEHGQFESGAAVCVLGSRS